MIQEFDQFWALYPRKVGKGAARKAWVSALRLEPAGEAAKQAIKHKAQRLNIGSSAFSTAVAHLRDKEAH